MRRCSRCKETKPESEFRRDKHGDLGSWCKQCHSAWSKEYRAARLAIGTNPTDTWRRNNQETHRMYNRRSELKKQYGITLEEYDAVLEGQDGVCAICHELCSLGIHLCVDHDHKTGKVRGLLCMRCNRAIGGFGDDVVLIRAALAYLESVCA